MNYLLKFLAYFGLITIPKRELKVGDLFVDEDEVVYQVLSVYPLRYFWSKPFIISDVRGILKRSDFENTEEFSYLGNIND